MNPLDKFISKTLKWVLIIFGLATCPTIVFAIDISLLPGSIDFYPSTVPALRHWGFMVFGIGMMLFISAFKPWLRFYTMLYSALEKGFMVYLWLSNLQAPWIDAYLPMGILDSIICAYSILYFISSYGRPGKWSIVNSQ